MRDVRFVYDVSNFDKKHLPLLKEAIRRCEIILGRGYTRFLEILQEEYEDSNRLEGERGRWGGLTADQFLQRFLGKTVIHGVEPITGAAQVHYEVKYWFESYYTRANVTGYGLPKDDITRMNTRYLAQYDLEDNGDMRTLTRTIIHEKTHDMGASHDSSATRRRKNAISYVWGRAVERAHDEFLVAKMFDDVLAPVPAPSGPPTKLPKIYKKKKPWWVFW